MKADIHPTYFDSVEIRCSCGNIIITGGTKEKLRTELCSKCHPFYTGTQKLIDTAGMVDKFEARKKATELHKQAKIEHERLKKVRKEEARMEKPRKPKPVKAAAPKIQPKVEVKKIKTAKPAKKAVKAIKAKSPAKKTAKKK